MRLWFGWIVLSLATVPWFLSFIISPYNTMGTSKADIRPGIPEKISNVSLAGIMITIGAIMIVFWTREARWGWKQALFAAVALFFLASGVARFVWVNFYI